VREAARLRDGREVAVLRRLEAAAGLRASIPMVSCEATHEPGVFGVVAPVLVWPRGFADRLAADEIEAILAHGGCHAGRRDNLAAGVHMIVQALYWFHPLVWWIGARLLDERERACDEEVLRLGSAPEVYAEGILKACRYAIEWPPACAAGVTGSDLRTR